MAGLHPWKTLTTLFRRTVPCPECGAKVRRGEATCPACSYVFQPKGFIPPYR
jgi:predicted amidophosphoribosyltransferase